MPKIMLVEDDHTIADMIAIYLAEESYSVQHADNGAAAKELFANFQPDLILLDLMLPDTDGMALCREFRMSSCVPVLILSAKHETNDRVTALLDGADDYLSKPFSMRELAARITALLRRASVPAAISLPPATPAAPAFEAHIRIDFDHRLLFVGARTVETTYHEFEIMRHFLANPGKVFERELLLNKIKGIDAYVTERAIDVHIKNLRRKIEDDPKDPAYIKTVWGVGYKYDPSPL